MLAASILVFIIKFLYIEYLGGFGGNSTIVISSPIVASFLTNCTAIRRRFIF